MTLLLLLVLQMWKATAGHTVSVSQDDGADDWETDPDFVVWIWALLIHQEHVLGQLQRSSAGWGLCLGQVNCQERVPGVEGR